MSRLLSLGLAAILLGASAKAQSGIFLDRSYVVHMYPDEGLLYEGQPAVPIILHNGAANLYSALRQSEPSWSTGMMWVLTPMFRIRQVAAETDASLPVRTPSFMPKLTAQFLAARRIGDAFGGGGGGTSLNAIVVGLDGTFGHYSNGQAGCFRANLVRKTDGSGDCVVDPNAGPGSDTLNTVDGSFSTWYLRGQAHVRLAHYQGALPLISFTINAGADWHPALLKPIGGMDTALAAVYGRIRPFAGAELTRRSDWACPPTALLAWVPCGIGRIRLGTNVEYLPTRPAGIPPVATTSELSWTFSRYAGLGALVRLHTGQDYYNIALGHELNVLQYGFVFDLERDRPLDAARRD
jgi:hypothetical protein